MQNAMWITTIVLLLGNLGFLVFILKRLAAKDKTQAELLVLRELVANLEKAIRDEVRASRDTTANTLTVQLQRTADTLVGVVGQLREAQSDQLGSVVESINNLTQTNETGIQDLRTSNDQMRQTVQDFKNFLTIPNTSGTWGEVQLGTILEQILTADQYDTNVRIKEKSRVEFAICLPGSDDQPDSCLWLPIDSKFPTADYQRLVNATDVKTEKALTKKFISTVESAAKTIEDKYIDPPKTTDFAIMFVPAESLYAEILREPGQVEKLQREYRIIVAGPTTLAAILSGLRIGFRTLATQKHSSEVWKLLAAVKTEFGKFADVLDTLKDQLNRAYNTIDVKTGRRVRAIHNKLQAVEELPLETAAEIGIPNEGQIDKGDADE